MGKIVSGFYARGKPNLQPPIPTEGGRVGYKITFALPAVECFEEMKPGLHKIPRDARDALDQVITDEDSARRAGMRCPPANPVDPLVEIRSNSVMKVGNGWKWHPKRFPEPPLGTSPGRVWPTQTIQILTSHGRLLLEKVVEQSLPPPRALLLTLLRHRRYSPLGIGDFGDRRGFRLLGYLIAVVTASQEPEPCPTRSSYGPARKLPLKSLVIRTGAGTPNTLGGPRAEPDPEAGRQGNYQELDPTFPV